MNADVTERSWRPAGARRVWAFTAVLMATSMLPACSDGDGYDGPVGTASIAIQQVPSDVRCISISVAGPRAVSKAFTVTPSGATTLTLPGLGAGANTFTGAAFPVACPSDLSMLVANWVADPVTTTLVAGAVTSVTLVMRPAANAGVNVDFQGGSGSGIPLGIWNNTNWDNAVFQ